MSDYEPVIGLEVHAELLTQSKMFCGCRVVDSVTAPPNTAVCPICLGMPGMLPVINRQAIELALRVALALNCTVQNHNVFARKNYFYPDLAKGYQISQYELPLATGGRLDVAVETGESRRIRVRRVHVEEDTGKLTHLEGNGAHSLVDFNRAGVPLLEIVSEPDLRSAAEARAYAVKLRQILRYLGVNSGDMEKGVIRFEANVSVRPSGSHELGTRAEVKNLNSFRSLVDAIDYETERQAAVLRGGGAVTQDTMGWNEDRRHTFSQRGKEEADDYRYFPDPDLPPLQIESEWLQQVTAALPELPDTKIARYQADLGLPLYDATLLAEERAVAEWFETAVAAGGRPKSIANWMINVLFRLMNERRTAIEQVRVRPADLVELIDLVNGRSISANSAKEVLAEMFETGQNAPAIVAARGLAQISDEDTLKQIVAELLRNHPDAVASYRSGKEALHGWFVGQVMKATGGKADPERVHRLLARQLASPEDEAK
jgi:aspartyl-tRNA(Asn)/glutamyl-tRNA(Gln) amidotransferase subunit B